MNWFTKWFYFGNGGPPKAHEEVINCIGEHGIILGIEDGRAFIEWEESAPTRPELTQLKRVNHNTWEIR